MGRRKCSIFVIIYTIFNIGLLIGASDYIKHAYKDEYNDKEQGNAIESNSVYENKDGVEEIQNKNEKLTQNNSESQISMSQRKKSNMQNKYISDDEVLNYSTNHSGGNTTRRNSSTQNTKVFKVTADEIISDLNSLEKAKILWVCRKLTKEEYNDIEEYLSYSNEKIGVMKVYDILEKKLDEDSLEEVKEIFSKYIDTEKVKEIYY